MKIVFKKTINGYIAKLKKANGKKVTDAVYMSLSAAVGHISKGACEVTFKRITREQDARLKYKDKCAVKITEKGDCRLYYCGSNMQIDICNIWLKELDLLPKNNMSEHFVRFKIK